MVASAGSGTLRRWVGPMAAVASGWDAVVQESEIDALRKRYEAQAYSDQPSPRLQFEFACLLVSSPKRAHIREGVRLLEELLEAGFNRTEVLHHLALTHLKLGHYIRAKEQVDVWLCLQPRNSTARLLHSLVLDRASHDGLIGFFGIGLMSLSLVFVLLRRWS